MKSTFLFAAIFIVAWASVFSQNCKYEKNEVDKFTKVETKITKPEAIYAKSTGMGLGANDFLMMRIAKYGDKFVLLVRYVYISKTAIMNHKSDAVDAAPDAKMLFLLANDSIITAYAQAPSASAPTDAHSTVNTLDLEFAISPEEVNKLKTDFVKSVRICKNSDSNQIIVEGELKAKYSDAVKKLATCVTQ